MTDKEFDIIGHSLGVNVYHARKSKKKKDKKLPIEYYRNYYQAGEGHHSWNELLHLHEIGLMSRRELFGQTVFHVTEEGKEKYKYKWVTEIEPSK
jgi:hypothetical protein